VPTTNVGRPEPGTRENVEKRSVPCSDEADKPRLGAVMPPTWSRMDRSAAASSSGPGSTTDAAWLANNPARVQGCLV
jgi:hypothetical protein